jgi:lipopolysaccharide export system permease protein
MGGAAPADSNRYLATNVAQIFSSPLAAGGRLPVINATEELQRVGAGRYGVRQALWFVFLTLPNEVYGLFPAAALLGTVIGLGGLAHRHELTAIAVGGVSRLSVVWGVLRLAGLLVVAGVLFSEFVAAPLSYRARSERSIAMSDGRTFTAAGGIWTRAGSSFVNLRTLLPDGAARDVYVYDFDDQRRMRRFTHAQSATYANHQWLLEGLVDKVIADDGVSTQEVDSRPVPIELNPRQLSLMRIPPEELSLSDLYRAIGSARRQGDRATHLELAWWQRATVPVVTLMSFLAVAILVLARATTWAAHRRRVVPRHRLPDVQPDVRQLRARLRPGADPQRASPHRDRASLRRVVRDQEPIVTEQTPVAAGTSPRLRRLDARR